MTIFSKSSIIFITINLLRVISIVALCLALSGELVVMISDIKGFRASQNSNITVTSTTPVTPSRLVRREIISLTTLPEGAATTTTSKKRVTTIPTSATSSSRTPAATNPVTTVNSPSSSSSPSTQEDLTCSYVGHTSVPKQIGGILFSVLDKIFCCILILFMLVAEMPPPSTWTQRFWQYAFPPFGDEFGVGVLGVIQVFVGCSMLSHALTGLPLVAGWFLFIVGFLNMLFGLSFGASIKSLRSVFSLPGSPSGGSGLRSLKSHREAPSSKFSQISLPLAHNASAPAGHQTPSPAYMGSGASNVSGSTVKTPIYINPLMTQVAPPHYPQSKHSESNYEPDEHYQV